MSKSIIETEERVLKDAYGFEEVRTTRKIKVHKTENENFYMVFCKYVGWIYGIKGVVPIKVLHYLMESAQINTGVVALTAGKRKIMLEELEISKGAFSQAISQLIETKAISKMYMTNKETGEQIEMKGEYMINPEMFWKGDREKRTELKVTFEATYTK